MMKMKNWSLLVFLTSLGLGSNVAFGYGSGISTFPLAVEKKVISTEITGILSSGGGVGLQARYTQKITEASSLDAGLGISGGERSARLFAGYDYEIFPDYDMQPRTSLKAFVENSKEFGSRRNIFGVAPTFSKGFNFWGHEAFPYISIPYGVSLNGKKKSYETVLSANFGATGTITSDVLGSSKAITANAEAIISLKNSFTGVFIGFGYPIE